MLCLLKDEKKKKSQENTHATTKELLKESNDTVTFV